MSPTQQRRYAHSIHKISGQASLSTASCNNIRLLVLLQSMIELSRTQDEEVGDGTTSVIILGKAADHAGISCCDSHFM